MNHLLNLGFLLAFAISASTLSAQDSTKKAVQIVFTQDMDEAALESIQEFVKPWGVDLTINGTEFENGLLHSIDFSVVTAKGNGSAKGEVRPDQRLGFRYDPQGGSKVALSVGSLDGPHTEVK